MNLFMYYLGGNAPGGNIEVHDVQFAAVDKPEAAFPMLAQKWFGEPSMLHVDSITKIDWADGYDVTLSAEPSPNGDKLFFVNMGGYIKDDPQEAHESELIVAKDPGGARRKAVQTLMKNTYKPHRDNQFDVDDCILLEQVGDWHVHLTPNADGKKSVPSHQGYIPIGNNANAIDRATGEPNISKADQKRLYGE